MWKLYQPQSACVHPVGARREKHRRASPSSGGNRPPAPSGACAYLRPRSRGCGGASSAGPPSNPEGQQGRTCGVSRNGVARAPPRKATGPRQAPLRPFGATVTPARAGSVLDLRPRRLPPPLGPRCHLPRGRPPRDRPAEGPPQSAGLRVPGRLRACARPIPPNRRPWTGRLREGARSYAKAFRGARRSAAGQRYSPVRLMCSPPSGETWEVGDQVSGPVRHGGFRPLAAEHAVFDASASDRTGARAAAVSRRRPSSRANRRSASQSCGLAGAGRLRSASAAAGADSSAFRMSP